MKIKAGTHEVQITVRANCRRMKLRYSRTEGTLKLSVPPGTGAGEIRAFLDKSMDWIKQTAGEADTWKPMYAFGERHWCLGRQVVLGVDAPKGEEAYLAWRDQQLIRVLKLLLDYWTRKMQVRVKHVTIRKMSSRWGSCRADTGRVTFSRSLALYDERLIEETVVHELCHFFHQNHSPAFYAEMTRWLPDWRARKKRRDEMDVRPVLRR